MRRPSLASRRAVGRSVALQKGGSPGSLGCSGAERGREHLRQARPQRHGRAACLFGAGPEQPQRGANAGRRGGERPSGRPAAGRERRLNGLRSHQKSPLSKMTLRLLRLRSALATRSPIKLTFTFGASLNTGWSLKSEQACIFALHEA